jgi:glycosyltransferase involved in cell wall biosynthesis
MKKKLIIFMPSIEGGGVEKNLFLVSNYLSKNLDKVAIITISRKYRKKFNDLIEFISLTSNYWDNLSRRSKYFLSIFLLIKEIVKSRNIIVFAFQANIYCIIICKLFSIKIIARSNSAPAGWSKNKLKRLIFKFFLNLADRVMVNSIEFRRDLKKEFGLNALCIYNPLNHYDIIKKSKKKSKIIFKNKKQLKILNIGRFTEQKDQITLLKALNEIKKIVKFEAVIIGRGQLHKKLSEYIIKNDLKRFVKIINFVDNPFPLLKQAELFILSSKYEGLPNVLLEALSLKKFIISSNCPTGPKEILLNGKGGLLFKVGDYKKLSEKIIYYYNNKKACKILLKNSLKNIERFDYEKNMKKYLSLSREFI